MSNQLTNVSYNSRVLFKNVTPDELRTSRSDMLLIAKLGILVLTILCISGYIQAGNIFAPTPFMILLTCLVAICILTWYQRKISRDTLNSFILYPTFLLEVPSGERYLHTELREVIRYGEWVVFDYGASWKTYLLRASSASMVGRWFSDIRSPWIFGKAMKELGFRDFHVQTLSDLAGNVESRGKYENIMEKAGGTVSSALIYKRL